MKVTELVRQQVQAFWLPDDQRRILEFLEAYQCVHDREHERICLAVLKLVKEGLLLERFDLRAWSDWRDVLISAELAREDWMRVPAKDRAPTPRWSSSLGFEKRRDISS